MSNRAMYMSVSRELDSKGKTLADYRASVQSIITDFDLNRSRNGGKDLLHRIVADHRSQLADFIADKLTSDLIRDPTLMEHRVRTDAFVIPVASLYEIVDAEVRRRMRMLTRPMEPDHGA